MYLEAALRPVAHIELCVTVRLNENMVRPVERYCLCEQRIDTDDRFSVVEPAEAIVSEPDLGCFLAVQCTDTLGCRQSGVLCTP